MGSEGIEVGNEVATPYAVVEPYASIGCTQACIAMDTRAMWMINRILFIVSCHYM